MSQRKPLAGTKASAAPQPSDLSIHQSCLLLSVSRATLWRMIGRGELAAYRASRSVRVRRESIEALRNGVINQRGE